jgi:RHS repeat-associated protein
LTLSWVKTFRHPSRSRLLRFVSRALILAFVVALLPPVSAHPARTDVQDLTRELPVPELASIAATADPHPVLWLVIVGEGQDLLAWFVVPYPELAGNYHRARWMDPRTGRFTGMDPWRGSPSDPATLHRYGYVRNDPANRRDPTGLYEGSLSGSLVTMAAVVTLSAAALLNYDAVVDTTRSSLSEPSVYYRVIGLAMTVAQVKLEQAAQQASMSLNVTGGVALALPIMLDEFNQWRRTPNYRRVGNHAVKFWYPSGPSKTDRQRLREYRLGSVRFSEWTGGKGGRLFMFVYKIGRNPVPGRGLLLFRLDHLSYETYPPVFSLEYELRWGKKTVDHRKLR